MDFVYNPYKIIADYTEGSNCERCAHGFYGDPQDGGHCFHQCKAKSVIKDEVEGHIGCSSSQGECLWIIEADGGQNSLIELMWTIDFAGNDCQSTTHKVEVYDGLPKFLSKQHGVSEKLGKYGNVL